jgi:hypothetical protein
VILYVGTVFFLGIILVIALTPVIQTWANLSVPFAEGRGFADAACNVRSALLFGSCPFGLVKALRRRFNA